MKEKLYAIPVNDAFDTDCECPVCAMRKKLEDDAVAYSMGPSYMEDDTRALTDELGFCDKHIKDVCGMDNKLGMALVLKTHMDKTIRDIESLNKEPAKQKPLFKKDTEENKTVAYIKKLNTSCFVCKRIDDVYVRYLDTIIFLYKSDENFRKKFENSKGFCTKHYGELIEEAQNKLKGSELTAFMETTNRLYMDNMKRVRDDLEWFINKFDYKYANESWKNSRDSIPRGITKTNSILSEE